MDKYKQFIITAKTSGGAAGFGKPPVPEIEEGSKSAPPTKDQIARWRARSDDFRTNYLKQHPNSKFKNITPRGSVVTRSKKLSNKKEAQSMVSGAASFLAGLGLRAGKISSEKAKETLLHLRSFHHAKDRQPFINKAVEAYKKYKGKMSKTDQAQMEDEASDLANNPRERPSKVWDRKGRKGKLAALVGLGICVGMFGGLAMISPDIAAFVGVKAIDLAWDSARAAASEPVAAFFAGHTISSFFRSKDSDEYSENVERKLSKKHDPNNELDEDAGDELFDNEKGEGDEQKKNPEQTQKDRDNQSIKEAVEKQLGLNFDASKYEFDENGNLKRKKANA